MSTTRSWGYALGGLLAVAVAAPTLAQQREQQGQSQQRQQQGQAQGQQHQTQMEQPSARSQAGGATTQRQLSPASQNAIARLHALNITRASYARLGADVAQEEEARSFLRSAAQEYEMADTRLSGFAQAYGVDLRSEAMQKKTKDTLAQWDKENEKLRKAKPEQAGKMALSTFIERNNDAIDDLRQLRGDVQEDGLRELINQRIALIEEQSTRAQELRQRVYPPSQGSQGAQQR